MKSAYGPDASYAAVMNWHSNFDQRNLTIDCAVFFWNLFALMINLSDEWHSNHLVGIKGNNHFDSDDYDLRSGLMER
jgi:hypothetical protein